MGRVEYRELDAFLMMCDTLHFGRAAEGLHMSQARVSQLIRDLERKVETRLFDRTSRRVELTALGRMFLADVAPARADMSQAIERVRIAARSDHPPLQVGYVGPPSESLLAAVEVFRRRCGESAVDLKEIPLADPFGPLRRRELDAAFICAPVHEPDLAGGPVLLSDTRVVAMSVRHRLAGRESLSPDDLGGCSSIEVTGPAPDYWTAALSVPWTDAARRDTPTRVATLSEALVAIAAGRGVMVFPARAAHYLARLDIRWVPLTDVPPSRLALVRQVGRENHLVGIFHSTMYTEMAASNAAAALR